MILYRMQYAQNLNPSIVHFLPCLQAGYDGCVLCQWQTTLYLYNMAPLLAFCLKKMMPPLEHFLRTQSWYLMVFLLQALMWLSHT